MKLKAIVSVAALTFGLGSVAYAADYFPPERINCKLTQAGKLSCEGFNHQYLIEDVSSANLTRKDEIFYFVSDAAFFTPNMSESTVYFTYKNADLKIVKIKSAATTIRPDFTTGSWQRIQDDLFICNAGYMHCPITNLPGTHG